MELGDGVVHAAGEMGESVAQVAVRLRVIGFETERGLVFGHGLRDQIGIMRGDERRAQIEMSLGIVRAGCGWPRWYSAMASGTRSGDGHQDRAQIVVRQPTIGIVGQRGAVERFGIGVVGGLAKGQHGETAQQSAMGAAARRSGEGMRYNATVSSEASGMRSARHGQVLEMVGDERVAEGIDVDEAERGKRVPAKMRKAASGPRCCRATSDQRDRHGEYAGRKQPLPPQGRVEVPARVGEGEIRTGQTSFGGVEPQGPAGQENALGEGQRQTRAVGSDIAALDPSGEEAGGDGDGEPGQQGQDVALEIQACRAATTGSPAGRRGGSRRWFWRAARARNSVRARRRSGAAGLRRSAGKPARRPSTKTPERVLFCSEIQATASTQTGCRAKSESGEPGAGKRQAADDAARPGRPKRRGGRR